jgi:SAM-dependent methyltransferase
MRRTYRVLYRLGITPWNHTGIPAPLAAVVEGPPPYPTGPAVDLGCGTGEHARYLAQHDWSVTAIDYTPEAIAAARRHDPTGRVTWRVADVTDLATVDPDGILPGTVTLLLDNGCLHGIPQQIRPGWAVTVNTLAAPDAVLLVRAAPRRHRALGPAGIDGLHLTALLGDSWHPAALPYPGWYRYIRA